ncbi:MAG: glycosyltransferase [Planctomycetaceae bacterium]|nr:glycosyltransferase [Planctomycetaceae bacterium]
MVIHPIPNSALKITSGGKSVPPESPLLVFADDWGRHPSSCQHLIKRLRRRFPVIWVNTIGTRSVKVDAFTWKRGWEKLRNWRKGLRQVDERMWVIDMPMLPSTANRWTSLVNRQLLTRRVQAVLRKLNFDRPIVISTLPHVWPLIESIPRAGVVYYCVDDFSHWPGADGAAIRLNESRLVRDADRVLAASEELRQRLSASCVPTPFPHAVDFSHFARCARLTPPGELAASPKPRIGFFGLIYEQLDFELLRHVALQMPEATLVMIGPIASCPATFRALPNVVFTGPKSYDELPQWIAACDVLMLAYRKDEMTKQVNPLKLKECLATGKPIVSVDIPTALEFREALYVASDRDEFVAGIRRALSEPDRCSEASKRQSLVTNDSWDARAEELYAILTELVDDRHAATA